METFSASLAICAGKSPITGKFPAQRPVMRSFDVFFDLRLNERLSKQSWDWWFETPSHPLWRQNDGTMGSSALTVTCVKSYTIFEKFCCWGDWQYLATGHTIEVRKCTPDIIVWLQLIHEVFDAASHGGALFALGPGIEDFLKTVSRVCSYTEVYVDILLTWLSWRVSSHDV